MFSFSDVLRYIRRMDIYKPTDLEFVNFGPRCARTMYVYRGKRWPILAYYFVFLFVFDITAYYETKFSTKETENVVYLGQKRITSSCTPDFVTQHTDGGKKESWEYPVIEGGGSFLPPACIQYPAGGHFCSVSAVAFVFQHPICIAIVCN